MLKKIESIKQLGHYLVERYGSLPQETCWVVAVNTQMQVLDLAMVSIGTLDHVQIHPRDVFRRLISVNAYGFILVHNHPSGRLTPSAADQQVWGQLALCSEIMKIHFLDFMIISKYGYHSYRTKNKWPKITIERLLEMWTNAIKM